MTTMTKIAGPPGTKLPLETASAVPSGDQAGATSPACPKARGLAWRPGSTTLGIGGPTREET